MPIYCNHDTLLMIPTIEGYESYIKQAGLKEIKKNMDRIVMDDYDAGFTDAVKLIEKKLDTIIQKYEDILENYDYIEEARDVELLLEIKQKLFKE